VEGLATAVRELSGVNRKYNAPRAPAGRAEH
jgi:hypothetical protein